MEYLLILSTSEANHLFAYMLSVLFYIDYIYILFLCLTKKNVVNIDERDSPFHSVRQNLSNKNAHRHARYTHISKGKLIYARKRVEKGKIELITKKTQKIYIVNPLQVGI
jgi:hypothetical protein